MEVFLLAFNQLKTCFLCFKSKFGVMNILKVKEMSYT